MSYPSCKHGHADENFPCPLCELETERDQLREENAALVKERDDWKNSGMTVAVELSGKVKGPGIIEGVRQLAQDRDALAAQVAGMREALPILRRIVKAMELSGRDFFIDGAQRAHATLCNLIEALALSTEPKPEGEKK